MARDTVHPRQRHPVHGGRWIALWLVLPVVLSPLLCLMIALDAGPAIGLDDRTFRAFATVLALGFFQLWIAVSALGAVFLLLRRRRRAEAKRVFYETKPFARNGLSRKDDRGFA